MRSSALRKPAPGMLDTACGASPGKRPRLVIVGNGMAGARVVEELLRVAPDLYDITVLGAEPHASYNRILLSPVLAGEQTLAQIMQNGPDWYATHGVEVRLGREATAIDRLRRKVFDAQGTAVPYDRLVLATGSLPIVLPVEGNTLANVVPYRTIANTQRMIEAAARHRDAVVIGGGLLGLEAAYGLSKRGMRVTVVHVQSHLMERQLDATAAEILRRSLESRGVSFAMGAETAALKGSPDGAVTAVVLKDGRRIAAGLVVMAVGIRPNAALAQAAGLACERGVIVTDTLQTYDPAIYAVGECVAHRGIGYGLVAPVYEMARVCANHLAQQGQLSYPGSVAATRLKVTGVDVFSAGDFTGAPGSQSIVLHDAPRGIYKKLVLAGSRLTGAVMIGDATDSGWYLELIRERVDVGPMRHAMMFGRDLAMSFVSSAAPRAPAQAA